MKTVRGWILPRLSRAEVRRYGLTPRATSWTIPLIRISIQKEHNKRRPWNISRESCYHLIKCSAANSLAALMKKWYMNSIFQPYSYSLKILGRCWWDKYQHQPFDLHVEGRDERGKGYKIKGILWERGSKKTKGKIL